MGNNDKSKEILLKLIDKNHKEAPLYILLGRIYKSQNNDKKALTQFQLASSLDQSKDIIIKNLINSLERRDDSIDI